MFVEDIVFIVVSMRYVFFASAAVFGRAEPGAHDRRAGFGIAGARVLARAPAVVGRRWRGLAGGARAVRGELAAAGKEVKRRRRCGDPRCNYCGSPTLRGDRIGLDELKL